MGLIQYGVERAGIPTISITHLVELTRKVRVPRALHLQFPLGRSFGRAGDQVTQRLILLDALHYLRAMEKPEMIIKLPYRWRGTARKRT